MKGSKRKSTQSYVLPERLYSIDRRRLRDRVGDTRWPWIGHWKGNPELWDFRSRDKGINWSSERMKWREVETTSTVADKRHTLFIARESDTRYLCDCIYRLSTNFPSRFHVYIYRSSFLISKEINHLWIRTENLNKYLWQIENNIFWTHWK